MSNLETIRPQPEEVQTQLQKGRTTAVLIPFTIGESAMVYSLKETHKEIGEFVGGELYFINALTTQMLMRFDVRKRIIPIMKALNIYIFNLKDVNPAPFDQASFDTIDKWDVVKFETCMRFKSGLSNDITKLQRTAIDTRIFTPEQENELYAYCSENDLFSSFETSDQSIPQQTSVSFDYQKTLLGISQFLKDRAEK